MPIEYRRGIKRPGQVQDYTGEQLKELVRCRDDIIYWAEKYYYVKRPDKGITLVNFKGRDYQKEFILTVKNNRFVIIFASRQSGKSCAVCINLLHKCIFMEGRLIGILAHKEKRAKSRLAEIKLAYERLPAWMKPGVTAYGRTEVEFENDNRIFIEATTEHAVAGEGLSDLLLDEFARVRPNIQEEFWAANYPAIEEGGNLFVVSTPVGIGDRFHKTWKDASAGRNSFVPCRADWWQVPGRDQEWKKRKLLDIGPIMFNREYGLSFMGSVNTLIESDILSNLSSQDPIETRSEGRFKIYQRPLPGHIYVIAVDVAEGVLENYSVIQVFDVEGIPWFQAAVYRANDVNTNTFKREVLKIAKEYNDALVVVENNSLGEEVVNYLWYDEEYENTVSDPEGSGLGVTSTRKTKGQSLMRLKADMEEGKYALFDPDTIQELCKFIKIGKDTFGPRAGNDDTVRALGWVSYFIGSEYWKQIQDTVKEERKEVEEKAKREEREASYPLPVIFDRTHAEWLAEEQRQLNKWLRED